MNGCRYITGYRVLSCGCVMRWQADRKDGWGTGSLLRPRCGKESHGEEMLAILPNGSTKEPAP